MTSPSTVRALVFLLLASAACVAAAQEGVSKISVEEFDKKRKEPGVVVLDVRTPQEYEAGHVPGAVNLNFNDEQFQKKVASLDKDKTYLVHCASGRRSAKAAALMKEKGFNRLFDFSGSMNAWNQAGKPVEKGPAKESQGGGAKKVQYPVTAKVDHVDEYHGVKVPDPYRWLEDPDSPQSRQWIEQQNAITLPYLKSLPMRDKLRERLTELWNYPRYGVPFREGSNYFFNMNSGLQNQPVLYVQPSLKGEPRTLLDPNALSKEGTVAIADMAPSEDGRLFAYGLSGAGSDWVELRVRQVSDAADLPHDVLKWVKFTEPSWTKDNKGFFYSRFPEPPAKTLEGEALRSVNEHHKIYYHLAGTSQDRDRLVFETPDHPKWKMGAGVTHDGRYAVIYLSEAITHNRLYYIDLKDPKNPSFDSPVVKLIDVFEASYEPVGNDGQTLYVFTDREAPRGRVIAIDLARPDRANWKTIIPQTEDTLETVQMVGDEFVCRYLHNAHSKVVFYDRTGKQTRELQLPGLGTVSGMTGDRDDTELFYGFTSFLTPPSIYRYDLKAGKSELYRRSEVKFDPSKYETKQAWYTSRDGTKVPMFITHRKGLTLDGNNPTYLTGYGGFRQTMTPYFSVSNAVWLENGGVLAIPNLRGGGEFGEAWHLAGTKERKQNVFDDFIAAAEFLIREKYTSPQKLAIGGGSNGGLLVGAVLNQRPDLFAAAIPAVGVMDMLRFHKFTIGSAWTFDYGSSDDPQQFKALLAYSPLHNIKPGAR
ncbi:MAG TPA: prolyl oligopeptidase family serine peptidase, partial [Tepidisphaeraceae bacterium]|nr:prolyl oligopeptidase family serine peptidase [Tepidisphaeraceae bacterium]